MNSDQPARPGATMRAVPTFSLVVLEALEDWRRALHARAVWRSRHASATTPGERGTATRAVDKYGLEAMRAEKRLKDALAAEVVV